MGETERQVIVESNGNQTSSTPAEVKEPTFVQICGRSCGCSLGCGFVVFLITFVIVALVSAFNWAAILGIAPLVGGMVFLASLILILRDSLGAFFTRRGVRRMLLAAGDANDKEFSDRYPHVPQELMREIRESIALFFNVPVGRIRAHHSLIIDLRIKSHTPYLEHFVIGRALEACGLELPEVKLDWAPDVKDLNDLAEQIGIAILAAEKAPANVKEVNSDET